MKDQHSAAANGRQLRRAYAFELHLATQQKREFVPPRLAADHYSREAIRKAQAKRARKAAKHAQNG